jgi:sugar phosphate permease
VAGGLAAGVNTASGRAVMAWFDEDERGLALGIRQMAVPLGGAVGAVALSLLERHMSLHAAFDGLAIGCLLAAVVAAVFIRVEPSEDHACRSAPPGRARISISVAVAAVLIDAPVWLIVPALVVATTFALSWNALSFAATAETAGRARSGAAIGLQQTFLAAGGLSAPIGFAAVVHQTSWRVAFALAAATPLIGYVLLSPLAERRP